MDDQVQTTSATHGIVAKVVPMLETVPKVKEDHFLARARELYDEHSSQVIRVALIGPRSTPPQSLLGVTQFKHSEVGSSVACVPWVFPSVQKAKRKASEMAEEGKDMVNSGGGGRYSSVAQIKYWDEGELEKVQEQLREHVRGPEA
ncbi:hypothetical protein LTR97_011757 [Elasticomyces elasticus]|uniref:Uncharacterized protein n=1 Tax=Elasticomyces elasticus TaxID=574655 RepID=A0AAN7ZQS5_9PEZI|nr:hypothetical protein LTR97_011757 [Elasticomyces elasticus]